MDPANLLSWLDAHQAHFGVQLATATLCGAIVGIERQLRNKAIGIRTSILICLATQVFVRLSTDIAHPAFAADPTRVLGQVVTGVGFLGAGVILARGGAITGVTSAAVVWMLAAIGSSIGVGRPVEAIGLSIAVVCILTGVRALEHVFERLGGGSDEPESQRDPEPSDPGGSASAPG